MFLCIDIYWVTLLSFILHISIHFWLPNVMEMHMGSICTSSVCNKYALWSKAYRQGSCYLKTLGLLGEMALFTILMLQTDADFVCFLPVVCFCIFTSVHKTSFLFYYLVITKVSSLTFLVLTADCQHFVRVGWSNSQYFGETKNLTTSYYFGW